MNLCLTESPTGVKQGAQTAEEDWTMSTQTAHPSAEGTFEDFNDNF